jgi:hypothetical protein
MHTTSRDAYEQKHRCTVGMVIDAAASPALLHLLHLLLLLLLQGMRC